MTPDRRAAADRTPSAEVVIGRPPRAAVVRFLVLAGLLLLGAAALRWTPLGELLDRERLAALLERLRQTAWAPWALVGAYAVASPLGLPVSPLVFAGGAVFGTGWGWLYNYGGCVVGATLSFAVGRRLGHDLVAHVLGPARLERFERLLERHGFWTLARLRLFPFPFSLLNYGSALAGVRFPVYLGASALGMAPSVLVYTYFSDAVVSVAAADRPDLLLHLGAALVLFLLVTFLPAIVRRLRSASGDG